MAKGRAARKDFDPADYSHVGYFYLGTHDEITEEYSLDHRNLEAAIGSEAFDEILQTAGKCESCGTRYAHGTVVRNHTDGTLLTVGQICGNEYFSIPSIAAFKAQEAARAKERKRIRASAEYVLLENPGLAEALEVDHGITEDIKRKLWRYGNLSQKQIALVFKLQREAAERTAEAEAEALIKYCPVPKVEHVEIEGLVLSEQWRQGYTYNSMDHKMLLAVDTPDGRFKVWATVPAAISSDIEKGDRVKVTFSSLAPSPRDDTFGFGKRPRNAEIIEKGNK